MSDNKKKSTNWLFLVQPVLVELIIIFLRPELAREFLFIFFFLRHDMKWPVSIRHT